MLKRLVCMLFLVVGLVLISGKQSLASNSGNCSYNKVENKPCCGYTVLVNSDFTDGEDVYVNVGHCNNVVQVNSDFTDGEVVYENICKKCSCDVGCIKYNNLN